MRVLLVGGDGALLEGLAQSFAAMGYSPKVVETLHDAREAGATEPALIAVVERSLASEASAEVLAMPLAPGGALLLFRGGTDEGSPISPPLQRAVLADLTLPLERNRLMALAQHVGDRQRATGRTYRRTPPEQEAF